jgi:hypothetical protein
MFVSHDTSSDGTVTPRLKVQSSDITFDAMRINYDTKTVDITAKIGNFFAKTTKPILL